MSTTPYVSTTNACKLCTPLGACLAFKGIEGAVPFLHGSQGCATYMRRYVISHFREPVDIASSALGEKHAVYGGGPNLKKGLLNVMQKYGARLIGVATTCLTETIGDDVPRIIGEFRNEFGELDLPEIVSVSTPSFAGTHMEGFHAAVRSVTEQLAQENIPHHGGLNLFPGMISPADTRHLRDICDDYDLETCILPDVSETLDGPALLDYERIPRGGTPITAIKAMPGATASIEFGHCLPGRHTAGTFLKDRHGVPCMQLPLPMGLRGSDAFFDALGEVSGKTLPARHERDRGRLVDAFVDGHKYIFGKRAVVYGEEDIVAGLVEFLSEIGVHVVLAATGSEKTGLAKIIGRTCDELNLKKPEIREGADFHEISELAEQLEPDLLIGHSKGYQYARRWNVPLVRLGFPIHDRFGGQRLRLLGYQGAQELFDRVVNAVLEKNQSDSPVGYGYL
ncbi:MAG: nitrogenase component 1 [Desulfovibrionaceae bacterium]